MESKRYSARLLFQYRIMGIRQSFRTCEERIVVMSANTSGEILRKLKSYGVAAEYSYSNDEGREVKFEFIGIVECIVLGAECGPEEVWYDVYRLRQPMERRRRLTATDECVLGMLSIGNAPSRGAKHRLRGRLGHRTEKKRRRGVN